ncbi:hypothetical protein ACFV0R_21465 [Streptomyces sp. NPDC059578]|uniref:hypothetical protein n=1 Tax=unclassified Streptomyces TaxID=2593676 RepID=UPI0036678CE5
MTELVGLGDVVELLRGVRELMPVTGVGVAGGFAARGWAPGGRLRDGFESSWDKGGVRGWVHPYDGGVRVELTVWMRDVDEDTGYFGDLEAVYRDGEAVLADVVAGLAASRLSVDLVVTDGESRDADDFVAFRRWALGERVLLAGVVQEDTDLPVRVVVVWEEER